MKFKSHDFNPIDHVTYLPVPPPPGYNYPIHISSV